MDNMKAKEWDAVTAMLDRLIAVLSVMADAYEALKGVICGAPSENATEVPVRELDLHVWDKRPPVREPLRPGQGQQP